MKKISQIVVVAVAAAWLGRVNAAEGFFRVEKTSEGRWWAVDPDGERTVIRGVDWVIYRGHRCEVDGLKHHYKEWNDAHYASPAEWEKETLERLQKWGFNMLGTGSDETLRHRGMVHAWEINFGNRFGKAMDENDERWIMPGWQRPCSALPNVFHPDFESYCDKLAAETCAPFKGDKDLLGWFLDNELAWWGKGPWGGAAGTYDACMAKPVTHSARKAAMDFTVKHPELKGDALKTAFLELVAERYFSVTIAAVKKYDPNHLILGCRFAGLGGAAPIVWTVAGRHADVVTFNCYPTADLDRNVMMDGNRRLADLFRERYAIVGKPMLITEWSFPALDSGLPCTKGAGQRFRTQKERARATELCAKTFLALPFLIGYDYFMWVDEPHNGISKVFPENSNYGLVSEKGVPYPEITSMFERLHAEVVKWHDAPLPAEKKFALDLVAEVGKGDALKEVKLNGRNYGSFQVMLAFKGGGTVYWAESTLVEKVEVDGRLTRVTVSGGKNGFDFAFDVEFEKTNGPGEFTARVTRLENRGKRDFTFQGLLLREFAEFVKTGADAPGDTVPNLWKKPKNAEWKAKDGRVYGAKTLSPLCKKIEYFWHKEENRPHPDALFEPYEQRVIKPGESIPLSPDYSLIGFLGE